MGELTIGALLGWIKDGGIIGILAMVLVGGARQWWVFGWQYQQLCIERDEWKELALRGTSFAEKAVGLAESNRN